MLFSFLRMKGIEDPVVPTVLPNGAEDRKVEFAALGKYYAAPLFESAEAAAAHGTAAGEWELQPKSWSTSWSQKCTLSPVTGFQTHIHMRFCWSVYLGCSRLRMFHPITCQISPSHL